MTYIQVKKNWSIPCLSPEHPESNNFEFPYKGSLYKGVEPNKHISFI